MRLTGQDIHKAYCIVDPDNACSWQELPELGQMMYNEVAEQLVQLLAEDKVTITAIRCPQCNEMLQSEHAEKHACWLEVK